MIKISINAISAWSSQGNTLLSACESFGLFISRFCFHSKLQIAGNCRLCLVEVEKSPKAHAACALPFISLMSIFTNTPLVSKAREGILEFVLLNHPLDCPICDQGGECDLQEQNLTNGSEISRFYYPKNCSVDVLWGATIKTIIQRCIVCTRCVRHSKQLSGTAVIGVLRRGSSSEIASYVGYSIVTELSGGAVDLCPVGKKTCDKKVVLKKRRIVGPKRRADYIE